jgi:hypothetical protein
VLVVLAGVVGREPVDEVDVLDTLDVGAEDEDEAGDVTDPLSGGGVCGREPVGDGVVENEFPGGPAGPGRASTARGSRASPTAQATTATTEPAARLRARSRRRARTPAHNRSRCRGSKGRGS